MYQFGDFESGKAQRLALARVLWKFWSAITYLRTVGLTGVAITET